MRFSSRSKKLKSLIEWAQSLAKGEGIINMTQGRPDFGTPAGLMEAVKRKMGEGWVSKYGPSAGNPELRNMVTESLKKEGVNVEDTIITVGGAEGCMAAMLTLLDPGDEVVLISPHYAKYEAGLYLASAKPVFASYKKTDEEFLFDIDAFKRTITRKTRMVILNSPANPTGSLLDKKDLMEALGVARENGFWILYDQVYRELVFDGQKHYNKEVYDPDHTLIIDSFSKTYSLSGWRVGSLSGAKAVIDEISKVHNSMVICPPTISQVAAIEAMKMDTKKYHEENRREYEKRRDVVLKRCGEIEKLRAYKPRGGMFVMLEPKDCRNDVLLVKDIVSKAKVGLVPGSDFGAVGMMRLSFCTVGLDQINEAFDRLEDYFKNKYPKFLKSREKPY